LTVTDEINGSHDRIPSQAEDPFMFSGLSISFSFG